MFKPDLSSITRLFQWLDYQITQSPNGCTLPPSSQYLKDLHHSPQAIPVWHSHLGLLGLARKPVVYFQSPVRPITRSLDTYPSTFIPISKGLTPFTPSDTCVAQPPSAVGLARKSVRSPDHLITVVILTFPLRRINYECVHLDNAARSRCSLSHTLTVSSHAMPGTIWRETDGPGAKESGQF
jgi:hypothetical protein